MAEFEELEELFEDIDEAGDDAAEDGEMDELDEEEQEEMEEEEKEMEESKKELKDTSTKLKELGGKLVENIKEFGKFFIKCSAMAAIMFGVNLVLSKLIHGKKTSSADKDTAQKKKKVVTKVNTLLKKESDLGTKITNWLVAHENTNITVEGMTIPLISIFQVYVKEVEKASKEVQEIFKKLLTKGSDGKSKFAIPTAGDISEVLDVSDTYVKTFNDIHDLIQKKKGEFPVLNSLDEIVTKSAIQDIRDDIGVVRKMPFP